MYLILTHSLITFLYVYFSCWKKCAKTWFLVMMVMFRTKPSVLTIPKWMELIGNGKKEEINWSVTLIRSPRWGKNQLPQSVPIVIALQTFKRRERQLRRLGQATGSFRSSSFQCFVPRSSPGNISRLKTFLNADEGRSTYAIKNAAGSHL